MNKLPLSLNKEQRRVATTIDGPVLVLAGAGSGKTMSIIHRTAYLIQKANVAPHNILIVTFTNKAARELRERLFGIFDLAPGFLWIGTFHSVCLKILRYEINDLPPYRANFSIYDRDDQMAALKKIYKAQGIEKKDFPLNRIAAIISKLKNQLTRPENYFDTQSENASTKLVHHVYTAYQNELINNNAMDFDDILVNTAFLLHDNKVIRDKYARKFRYVMIDEYQDTNYAQFKIINLIAQEHQNLCVVGDDDQAIYAWRGADIRNILNFENDYKNALKIRLEQNYRSTSQILDAANCLIKHNTARHPKTLWTDKTDGTKPALRVLDNDLGEVDYVAQQIKYYHKKKKINWPDMAVLYRTNAQSRVFESKFRAAKIPYQIVGGMDFFQRKEIKDIIAYLRLLSNPSDTQSILRIINFPPRGIGKTSVTHLLDTAIQAELPLISVLLDPRLHTHIRGKAKKSLEIFGYQIGIWQNLIKEISVEKMVLKVIEDLGLIEMYSLTNDPKDIARAENIKEFIASSQEFAENYLQENEDTPFLDNFLQNLSLQTDLDQLDNQDECVSLMTMHNAKGLEFKLVFCCGIEEGLIPHALSIPTEEGIEEERRLLYVGMTRARDYLHLSYARIRRTWEGNIMANPSRFFSEIDQDLLAAESPLFYEVQAPLKRHIPKIKTRLFKESELHKGQQVTHKKFGTGIILNIEGKNEAARLTISFNSGQLKKILASYVKAL